MNRFPTPSEMMRTKRPYLFSDSECIEAYQLSESELSHHLDTLTDRNQHKDFEVFCRKLCERELCPNLRPQTGPEGGGDGKVDTETYPVNEQISERWYVGGVNSGAERWGFAFSAKKNWSDKVRSDVKGIIDTKRSYDRIIFITSRPARQRDRLRLEEELYEVHGVKVTIFDREWIIDRVFSNGHKDFAYNYLRAGRHDPGRIKLGPRDFKRQQALDEIESRIRKLGTTPQDQTQSVSDTFEAACLSRELERPRFETEGRFQRAIVHAKKYGASFLHLRAVYEHAWTSFWWFDDVDAMQEQYEIVENVAFASGHTAHISKIWSLHQLLVARIVQGHETPDELSFSERSSRLKGKLIELAADKSRPNNALHAETLFVFNRMNEKVLAGNRDSLDEIWLALSEIIDRAAGLGEFPADLLETMVAALSEVAPDSSAFDKLIEKLAEFMAERNKEITAGDIYLTQGKRKLDAGKPIDGIKWLGRAVVNFSKEECREQQATALYYLAVGYRSAELLWAARATALSSVMQNFALSELEGEFCLETIQTLILFATICLQIGHLLDFLSAIHFIRSILISVPLSEESQLRLRGQLTEFDRLLACLLVIQSKYDIRRLERVPDVLENLELYLARLVLLYRLGHIETLKAEGTIPKEESNQEFDNLIKLMITQPACSNLPKGLIISDDLFTSIRTRVLGVLIEFKAPSILEGFLLAETHVAAFEGLAATLLNRGVFPYTEKFSIRIYQNSNTEDPTISEIEYFGVDIAVPSSWRPTEVVYIGKYNEHLISSAVYVLTRIAVLPDVIETIEQLAETERALERATLFCHVGISRNRVFGAHVGRISDWDHWITKAYPMSHNAPPNPQGEEIASQVGSSNDGELDISDDLRSHNDLVVRSIINAKLWDAAKWWGIVYGFNALGNSPLLGLVFSDAKSGKTIFKEWCSRFGHEDSKDAIRVAVIKGIDSNNPFHYRAYITQELDPEAVSRGKKIINVSRIHTMTVADHYNLDTFMQHLQASGSFFLVPVSKKSSGELEFCMELAILKRKFYSKAAWQIGPHDIDMMAITSEDDVIIPDGESDAPVKKLFAWRQDGDRKR